jgi:hypothetical protein
VRIKNSRAIVPLINLHCAYTRRKSMRVCLKYLAVVFTLIAILPGCRVKNINQYGTSGSAKAITSFSFVSPSATGTINEATKTIAVTVPYGTDVTTLVATFITTGKSVNIGSTTQVSGTTPNNFTAPVLYKVTAVNGTSASYTVAVTTAANTAKAITAFSFTTPAAVGSIDETAKTIAVTVPYGTVVTNLVATFITTGASVRVGATAQVSGTTPNDYTGSVAYVVTAADSSSVTYTVTVTVALNSAKAVTSFSLLGISGTIDEAAKTIAVTVPYGTDVTALVATFTTTGTNVAIGSTIQVSGTTANNFTNPVAYVVTAADSTTATYTVTVTISLNPAKEITAFSFPSVPATGAIDDIAKTIAVQVMWNTDVTTLAATFTTTGASVRVGSTIQANGTTTNDFTNPVAYVVTAADSSTATYTVTVTKGVAPKALTSFSIVSPVTIGAINETLKTAFVIVPQGTTLTSLIATFTTTGASVEVGSTAQVSGTTPNDFTGPITYTVVGGDGLTVDYAVTVISSAINLPRTGQVTSYAAGDDGALQKGVPIPSSRFTLGVQTITDALTGLMWARYANTPVYTGVTSTCAAGARTWQGASDYIVCLNANNYMFHADWRLPNKNELKSLVDYGQSNLGNYLQTAIDGVGFINPASRHWTSSTYAFTTTNAWFTGFSLSQGAQDAEVKTDARDVWPVRDDVITPAVSIPKTGQTTIYSSNNDDDGAFQKGVAWPNPRFINADGTPVNTGPIIDKLTDLMWTQDGNAPGPVACSPAVVKTWQEALDYVVCLNTNTYLGYNDWRLPNINEVDSIFDNAGWYDSGYNPWPNTQGFINVPIAHYWTSTTYAGTTSNAWYVVSANGVSYIDVKTATKYVWPVRGGY